MSFTLTATHWFLIAVVLTLACLLVLHRLIRAWHTAEQQLEYRTADWSAIDSDTRKLQAQVPNAQPWPPRRVAGGTCTGTCTGNCNQGRACTCSPQQAG